MKPLDFASLIIAELQAAVGVHDTELHPQLFLFWEASHGQLRLIGCKTAFKAFGNGSILCFAFELVCSPACCQESRSACKIVGWLKHVKFFFFFFLWCLAHGTMTCCVVVDDSLAFVPACRKSNS